MNIKLQPDWRLYLIPFTAGVLLVPVFGVGLFVLWFYWRTWYKTSYLISDSEIRILDKGRETVLQLHEITDCTAISQGLMKRFGLGHIHLRTASESRILLAIKDAKKIASFIGQAAEEERERARIREELERMKPSWPVGTLENKNDLVALWQEGLIREEDYKRELKKFE
ncbi:PH domain-containing protein [Balneolaceae bacterium ANBcel3]|nr:PH domain-containing protein [Balneolaceae bacterium ANBcel3]